MLNGDGNKNGKKNQVGLISKNLAPAAHFLVRFFAVVLHDYNVKRPSYKIENVVCVPARFFFFYCRSSLFISVVASIFSPPPLQNFNAFLPTKFLSFFYYLSL